ncbi:multicopper oxidase domain-containing protein [Nocardioides terrisoli]|uniref:multicopper oxidase domain-containing protein n=1 Tax=Nocardioides terrisoli TaxID=3388267 RepID=UPI00287BAC1C|nr:multicopper oxidase domain-containing protein [Nocardioides marmorisolisilvae]
MRIANGPVEVGARRRFNPMRDIPAVLWLLAVVVVALVHRELAAPRWLMFHLLLLGAVTHSILVWSQHFADALLHTAPTSSAYRNRTVRLVLLNLGALVVVLGVTGVHWEVAAAGGTAVVAAVGWHGVSLVLQLRRALGSRFAVTVRFYVASAALLPVGVLFGVLMVRGAGMPWHARLMTAHVVVNVLGWMGLTVMGTMVTLWPTMLRTRIVVGAETIAARALWVLLGGIVVAVGGCLVGQRLLVTLGLLGYAAGLVVLARPFALAMRSKPPLHFPTWSVLAAVSWLTGVVVALAVGVGVAPGWMAAHELLEALTPALAAGFGAQVLLGALSYLIPVAVGGGPAGARAANTVLDRGSALRVMVVNAGLVVCLLPVPAMVRLLVSVTVLVSLASFLPLMFAAMRAARQARDGAASMAAREVPAARRTGPAPVAGERPRGQITGLAAAGFAVVVLAVAVGVALDPAALAGTEHRSSADGVVATGHTTHVVVRAANMRFTPSTVSVPAGNRLVIDLRNTDAHDVHDLVLDSGAHSPRLGPGESATVNAGVVGRDIEGWCSMPGHRQLGMVFHVRVTGLAAVRHSGTGHDMPGMDMGGTTSADHRAAAPVDLSKSPPAGFRAHDPVLPALPHGRVIRRTFTVSDVESAVAPGVRQDLWTYNGTMPGPTLHGRIGDRFVIRLVNDTPMGHSIDFHAGQVAPDRPMRTLAPGQALTYRFTAHHSGIWLYHCSTMPMAVHVANGMFGAVVIDPPHLPPVAHSYVLLQSELYLGAQGGSVDVAKVLAERPDAVVFNGYADQYDADPLTARVGQRIRIWVLDAGPDRPTSFHVVGGQFDTVFSEGAYLLRRGNPEHGAAQVLSLGPAQGGFVEISFRQPGHYPFMSHLMVDAGRGAHGIIRVRR